MHTSILLIATITAAASLTAAAVAPPQITTAPSAQDTNMKLLLARGGAFEHPQKRYYVQPPAFANVTLDPIECACISTIYRSITKSDFPCITDRLLRSWMVSSLQRTDIRTITDIAQVDDLCIRTREDPNQLKMPSSLTDAFWAWQGEMDLWKTKFHDKAHWIAERCGTRVGPVFSMLAATDRDECRTAVSAFFRYYTPETVSTMFDWSAWLTEGETLSTTFDWSAWLTEGVSLSASGVSSGSGPVGTAILSSTATSTLTVVAAEETNPGKGWIWFWNTRPRGWIRDGR